MRPKLSYVRTQVIRVNGPVTYVTVYRKGLAYECVFDTDFILNVPGVVTLVGGPVHYYPLFRYEGVKYKAHKFAMPGVKLVDHINGNTLDCRLENLRTCTRSENGRNRIKRRRASSQFLGVSWHKLLGKWTARINQKHIGYYATELEAFEAYKKAAKQQYGAFASWTLLDKEINQ